MENDVRGELVKCKVVKYGMVSNMWLKSGNILYRVYKVGNFCMFTLISGRMSLVE